MKKFAVIEPLTKVEIKRIYEIAFYLFIHHLKVTHFNPLTLLKGLCYALDCDEDVIEFCSSKILEANIKPSKKEIAIYCTHTQQPIRKLPRFNISSKTYYNLIYNTTITNLKSKLEEPFLQEVIKFMNQLISLNNELEYLAGGLTNGEYDGD